MRYVKSKGTINTISEGDTCAHFSEDEVRLVRTIRLERDCFPAAKLDKCEMDYFSLLPGQQAVVRDAPDCLQTS